MKIRRLARDSKALSPVIATIILVAVTVAIAIAVAAWLGALTFTYTNLEQVNITGGVITVSSSSVALGLSNIGTTDVVFTQAQVTGGQYSNQAATAITGCSATGTANQVSVPKGSSCTLTAAFVVSGKAFAPGTSYQFTLVSSKGHNFLYTVTA